MKKDKALRRLGRKELLEIIYTLKQQQEELQAQLDEANRQLADRTIRLENAGSIAQAALAINNVMEAAQAAADSYLASVQAAANRLAAQAEPKSEPEPEAGTARQASGAQPGPDVPQQADGSCPGAAGR